MALPARADDATTSTAVAPHLKLIRSISMRDEDPGKAVTHTALGIGVDGTGEIYVSCKSYGIRCYTDAGDFDGSIGLPTMADAIPAVDGQGMAYGEAPHGVPYGWAEDPDSDDYVLVDGAWKLSINGHLFDPRSIVVDRDGNSTVVDCFSDSVQTFNRAGNFMSSFRLEQSEHAAWYRGICRKANGNILIGDNGQRRILEYSPTGDLVNTIKGTKETMATPDGLAAGSDGSIYVADWQLDRVSRIDKSGNVLFSIKGDLRQSGCFENPLAVAVDSAGRIYVGAGNGLYVYDPEGKPLSELKAPEWGAYLTHPDDPGPDAKLHGVNAIFIDKEDHVYAADAGRIMVFKPY